MSRKTMTVDRIGRGPGGIQVKTLLLSGDATEQDRLEDQPSEMLRTGRVASNIPTLINIRS